VSVSLADGAWQSNEKSGRFRDSLRIGSIGSEKTAMSFTAPPKPLHTNIFHQVNPTRPSWRVVTCGGEGKKLRVYSRESNFMNSNRIGRRGVKGWQPSAFVLIAKREARKRAFAQLLVRRKRGVKARRPYCEANIWGSGLRT